MKKLALAVVALLAVGAVSCNKDKANDTTADTAKAAEVAPQTNAEAAPAETLQVVKEEAIEGVDAGDIYDQAAQTVQDAQNQASKAMKDAQDQAAKAMKDAQDQAAKAMKEAQEQAAKAMRGY